VRLQGIVTFSRGGTAARQVKAARLAPYGFIKRNGAVVLSTDRGRKVREIFERQAS
jgi:hypothetical protein